jgi:hypothetical protein
MSSITITRLIECAERETKRRKMVYPRSIAKGKMSLTKSEDEIRCMERIVELLKTIQSEPVRKLKSFA